MGLAEKFRKAANDAAYAAGYGYGKVRSVAQDVAQKPEVQKAVDSAKRAMNDAADKAASLTDHLPADVRSAVDRAVPAIEKAASSAGSAVAKAAPVVQGAVAKAAPAVKQAASTVAEKAVPVVRHAATSAAAKAAPVAKQAVGSAAAAARKAGSAAAAAVVDVAAKNAASMRDADAHPHTVVDSKTGQKVTVEAYVRRPDGSHDYDSVYPHGTKSDFGPIGNKLVGTLLILAGVPMLVLPGPGLPAIMAGLHFWRKGDDEDKARHAGKPEGPEDQAFHRGEDASDPSAAAAK